jgi:hypothetical protein
MSEIIKQKHSAYGIAKSSFLSRALRTGQKAGSVSQEGTRRNDLCSVFQENRIATIHAVPAGAVRAEHHVGQVAAGDGQAQMRADGHLWQEVMGAKKWDARLGTSQVFTAVRRTCCRTIRKPLSRHHQPLCRPSTFERYNPTRLHFPFP